MLASILWQLLTAQRIQSLNTNGSAGHKFEDLTAETVYSFCVKKSSLRPFPPRYTLKLPSVSGLHHQIDVVVSDTSSIFHLVECKFRQSADIEELYAFNGKLLDYAFGLRARDQKTIFRGYFLTSYPSLSDNFFKYALAWGITLITPDGPPPPEYMLSKTDPESALHKNLSRLVEKTTLVSISDIATMPREPDKLLGDLRSYYQYWKREGYGS